MVQQPKISVLDTGAASLGDWYNNSVCVEKCPTKGELTHCLPIKGNEDCPTSLFATEEVLWYCIPTPASINAFTYTNATLTSE